MNTDYDYIIAGGGCAGLSLAVHIANSDRLKNKKVLIVDKSNKQENDRTWCFWEIGEGKFENLVYKKWNQLEVGNTTIKKALDIHPYQYKLIRGADYYQYCLALLSQNPNFTFRNAVVDSIVSDGESGIVISGEKITANYIFNSLYEKPVLNKKHHWLLQHFKGWYIKSEVGVFDPEKAMLMDFDTDQKEGTTFFYVLPFSTTEALIEYTLFSPTVLKESDYDDKLSNYISRKLNVSNYEVVHREFGVIPMTNYKFPRNTKNVVNIGTAGGMTKGSSGYTFQNIQKHSVAIVSALENATPPEKASTVSKRHQFYDSVLLDILANRVIPGDEVFMQLFRRNKAASVFKFLDNETTLSEELPIIGSLPTIPFSKAALRQLFT